MRGARRGGGRPRLRAHRRRQDRRGRVRDPQGPRRGAQGVLHDADQGAVQPEVRRPGRAVRPREGRPADRRQRRQRRRPGGRDDHRGAAQHALRRVPGDRRPRLRGHGRGALPRRPLPRRRLGRGDHPPPAVGHPGLAVGDGEQRRGVRRLAGHRPRPHEGRRQRGAADPAVAAHAGRQPGLRPVLPPPRRARRRARRAAARARRRASAAARWSTPSWSGSCASTSGGSTAGAAAAADAGTGTATGTSRATSRRRAPTSSSGWTAPASCPRSPSSSAATAATPRSAPACAPACG